MFFLYNKLKDNQFIIITIVINFNKLCSYNLLKIFYNKILYEETKKNKGKFSFLYVSEI